MNESYAERVEIMGCPIDRVSLPTAVERIEGFIAAADRLYQAIGINLDQLLKMKQDPEFARIVSRGDLLTADGQSILWLGRIFKQPLPERVPGVDIMCALLPRAAEKGYRVFMLGTRREILSAAVANLQMEYPGVRVCGSHHGFFSRDEEPAVVEEINRSRADILFIAISSPKKELFVDRNREGLKVRFALGVGGAFDILAGVTARSPLWMQRSGVEWVWRIIQEPRRMIRRLWISRGILPYVFRELRNR